MRANQGLHTLIGADWSTYHDQWFHGRIKDEYSISILNYYSTPFTNIVLTVTADSHISLQGMT